MLASIAQQKDFQTHLYLVRIDREQRVF